MLCFNNMQCVLIFLTFVSKMLIYTYKSKSPSNLRFYKSGALEMGARKPSGFQHMSSVLRFKSCMTHLAHKKRLFSINKVYIYFAVPLSSYFYSFLLQILDQIQYTLVSTSFRFFFRIHDFLYTFRQPDSFLLSKQAV